MKASDSADKQDFKGCLYSSNALDKKIRTVPCHKIVTSAFKIYMISGYQTLELVMYQTGKYIFWLSKF